MQVLLDIQKLKNGSEKTYFFSNANDSEKKKKNIV